MQTLEAWQSEMKERFPRGSDTVAFVCPACKNVATIAQFRAAGVSEHLAPQECLFRSTDPEQCDWCAYGLLQSPREIQMPDGKTTHVFEFAPSEILVEVPALPEPVEQ